MSVARRLAFHGALLFLLGLVMGIVVPYVASPRVGLSAHTGTILNGAALLGFAAVWSWVVLPAATAAAAYWLLVVGSYVGCAFLFLAGVLGTHSGTPLHGPAQGAEPWKEMLVSAGLSVGGIVILAGAALAVWGLRGRSA